jgi:EAL domain-containing protein (putative c-di-GMP-specific phosphodiesterase class I)
MNMTAGRSENPLCFLMDEEFVFRQDLAKQLRRDGVDVVEFSDSSRIMDMADDQNPGIVFVNLNGAAPHECVRALFALKECEYSGVVQLFGRCEMTLLESLNTVGTDCSLTMLPPIQKPIKAATIHKIIFDQKYNTASTSSGGALLSDALLKNLVKFLYQPKFDLKTNTMIGVEVVARVAHPKLGLLTPDQFLKGADEDDLLKLSRLALVNALTSSAHFHELGISLLVAININVENLLKLAISDLVLMHRPQCSVWAGILLEVPERQVVNKIERLKVRLPKLQQSGVSIAIDNFGRGSTHLHILNQIPVSEIKLDRSLVQECATNTGNANICKTFIQMAHNFGSRAVAVGISTDADLRTLCGLDCDIGQGFLLGKPMGRQAIDTLIASFKSRIT